MNEYVLSEILACLVIWGVIGLLIAVLVSLVATGFDSADPRLSPGSWVGMLVFAIGAIFCILE